MRNAAAREVTWLNERVADPEQRILDRIARGERDALGELYARFQAPLFRYLVQLIGDPGLAEEVLQDTLVAVWQGAASFAGRSSVQTWLIGIARRQAHNHRRRRALPLAGESELEVLAASEPEPEDAMLASVEREELAAAIRCLAPVHREALTLAFVNALSYREMAVVLEVPEGTVKSRLSNAKRALRLLLDASEGVER
ncbi:MAG: RNA polymerase sigma factor [Chloroflexota bacterium]